MTNTTNRPGRRSGKTIETTRCPRAHIRRACDKKTRSRRNCRRRLSSRVRRPRDFSAIEVFDFSKKWHLVKAFLHRPEIEAVLERGLADYCQQRAFDCIEEGLSPSGWQTAHVPGEGPWTYCSSDYWATRVDELAEAAMDRGEFQWQCVEDGEPSDAEWERYFEFAQQFYPQQNTFQWYQLWGACHWLAPWLKELGRLVFPELRWHVLIGPRHSLACGTDPDRNIKVLFDILNFEKMSAKELIQFASCRPQSRSARQQASTSTITR